MRNSETDIREIQILVAFFHGVSVDDLEGSSRARRYTEPRQIAIYLCRKHTRATLKEIGAAFGNRHYSTIIDSVETIKSLIEVDRAMRETCSMLDRIVKESRLNLHTS